MASKKRLGRSLTDLLADIDNRTSRGLEALIPTVDPGEHEAPGVFGELLPGFFERDKGEFVTETPPEFVEDAKPPKDNYGQGPSRSTRVAVHKFVPNLVTRAGVPNPENMGTVYVKFQPHMNGSHANDVWFYKNVPYNVYEDFSNSTSKGRFINQFLNSYPKGRTKSREDRYHTKDFRG